MSRVYREFAAIFGVPLAKAGGPFIGPKGGRWADAAHTIPWKESIPASTAHQLYGMADRPLSPSYEAEAKRINEERRFWEDKRRNDREQRLLDAEHAENDAFRELARKNAYERQVRLASEAAAHEAAKGAVVDDILAVIPSDFDPDEEPLAGAPQGDDALSAGVREYLGHRGLAYDIGEIVARVRGRLSSRA